MVKLTNFTTFLCFPLYGYTGTGTGTGTGNRMDGWMDGWMGVGTGCVYPGVSTRVCTRVSLYQNVVKYPKIGGFGLKIG